MALPSTSVVPTRNPASFFSFQSNPSWHSFPIAILATLGITGLLTVPSVAVDMVVVVGAPGAVEYQEQFESWAQRWTEAAELGKLDVVTIGAGDQVSGDSNDRERLFHTLEAANVLHADGSAQNEDSGQEETADPVEDSGSSDRSPTQAEPTEQEDETSLENRPFWLVMIGHGTFAADIAKFNLQGPDISAADLSEKLDSVNRPTIVVNCSSSSGPFINRLSRSGRIVVTATKSGNEQNYSRFGDYFAAAIASPDADLDHDDEVSVLEAFLKASSEVERFYSNDDRLATEHALIDDNGDERGTPFGQFQGLRVVGVKPDQVDGRLARRFTLVPAKDQVMLDAAQLERRNKIEEALEKLRAKKADLEEADYWMQLESLLLQQAHLYQEVDVIPSQSVTEES